MASIRISPCTLDRPLTHFAYVVTNFDAMGSSWAKNTFMLGALTSPSDVNVANLKRNIDTWACGCWATSIGTNDWDTAINKINTSLYFISSICGDGHILHSTWEHAVWSLTTPRLQCCCTVWNPHKKKAKDQLEMVNRRARYIFNKRWRDRSG